ncbi:MAG TPA: ATP-binding protein, partial [Polyangiaceae bacterium]|nr:ATP-binding protein [Polyangiaceae bacterium]
ADLQQAQSQLVQSAKLASLGELVAGVAHEINNPLTYVLANLEEAELELARLTSELEALKRSEPSAATMLARVGRLKHCLDPVAIGTKRIRDVTRQLKTFTRPDDEQLTRVNVPWIVRSVLDLLRKEIEARARLVEEIGESPVVRANDARLVQVLTNLLMNAWQAVPTSDPTNQVIGVRTGSLDGDALIEIWDSGSGVQPQLREQIFEPFVTTKDVGSGTGLGLFVCRNIVNALHGRISVHDAPGGGALFRVTLPAMTESAPLSAPEPRALPQAGSLNRRRRVLIIDDDPRVAGSLASRLGVEPFDVQKVLDARQGLALLLADASFDLVYCDVMMKDLTGIDLYEALRRQAPERLAKLVFMTGGAFTAEARTFLEQRGDGHVQKPFDILVDARRRSGLP